VNGGLLNGLDLFSGIGGITLALAPWVRPVAYCEIDEYASWQDSEADDEQMTLL
jgi:tRNA/tmRNA/rRNA uracil-C5-methylase (TrmA/RlmC/RlmD family)